MIVKKIKSANKRKLQRMLESIQTKALFTNKEMNNEGQRLQIVQLMAARWYD